jgi:Uma2 family endonuclease
MTPPALQRLATAADLLALPEERRAEVIRGVIVEQAAPGGAHGGVQVALAGVLFDPFQRGRGGPGGWWLASEVDIELERHEIYRPDVLGWRRDRVPERPRERVVRVRPDWVCEILSPTNAATDLGPKLITYHRAGIPHYWIVDPEHRALTVFRATDEGYVIVLAAGPEDIVHAPPFDAMELKVSDLFH